MAIKVKSKKPPRGAGRSKKKKKGAPHSNKAHGPASSAESKHAPAPGSAESKHAPSSKSLLARKPAHKAHGKKPFVRKSAHSEPRKSGIAHARKSPREFTFAAEPAAGRHFAGKKKKKKQMVLRFTENTLKDIAALECVRRCFR